jgi:dolichol-phosphate mannosyltransferase
VTIVTIDTRPTSAPPRYSLVIPIHNEELTLPELHNRLLPVLEQLDGETEVLLVDDGSKDASWQFIDELHSVDGRFKGVQLSRNFGHQVAITAGMDLSNGQAVAVMDADLQDPPEVLLEMAAKWRQGYEIVYGVRENRSTDSWFKRTSASLFYRILNRLSEVDIPRDVGDFRLVDQRVVEAFRAMRESNRFVRGMYAWVGFRQIGIPYQRDVRFAGDTKYPLKKMMRLAGDAVFGFSRVPLRLAMKIGVLTASLALIAGVVLAGMKIVGEYAVPGWTSILFALCLIGGLQLAFLGMIGQYIGRTYEESLGRPLYIVSHLLGASAPLRGPRRAVVAEPATVATILGNYPASRSTPTELDLRDASALTGAASDWVVSTPDSAPRERRQTAQ